MERSKQLPMGICHTNVPSHPWFFLCGPQVDPALDVVKGRGGALLREKMVEMASDLFVCIVDDTKLVSGLGACSEQ